VRLAIGATRQRILRQLLSESILLGFAGGVAGYVFALWGVRLLVSLLDSDAFLPLSPDLRVLGFTFAVSLATGVLFGIAPALRELGVPVAPTLKEANRATTDKASRFGWGKGLIAGQVAISLLVLFAACLLVRSLQKLMAQDFGYDRNHLVIAGVDAAAGGYSYEKMKPLAQELASRISSTPGIRSATYSNNGLFAGTESSDAILVPGFSESSARDRTAYEDYIGPSYFEVVDIPVLAGRGIEDQDSGTSTRVAVVNQAWVKKFFGGQNPIGRQFRIDDAAWLDKPISIVGICADARDHASDLRAPVKPRFYLAYQQVPEPFQIVIEAQAAGAPSAAVANVVGQIKATDAHLVTRFATTLESRVSGSASDQIALAKLSSFFAGLGLLLACVGLYGVLSYTVAGRTREIGIRMALGAACTDVLKLVLREALLLVGIGLIFGIPLSLVSSRLLGSFLFGLTATDPLSLAAVILLLMAVSLLAGMIPARRAAKVEPMVALRYE
jgi:predicted permease